MKFVFRSDGLAPTARRGFALCALLVVGVALFSIATASAAGDYYIGPPAGVLSKWGTAPLEAPSPFAPPTFLHARVLAVTCPALDSKNNPTPSPSCNMTYHNGPLLITNTTHIVYWEPSGFTVSSNYHSLIERYLGDVAADSGRVSNPYATDTQYTDSVPTNIQYSQTYAGTLTDTNAFPSAVSGCNLQGSSTVCLTETQETDELDSFLKSKGAPRGLNNIYFLVLPKKVQTCFDSFSDCGPYGGITDSDGKFHEYCAYHSSFDKGNGNTAWANMPYGADGGCNVISNPPNGDDADTLIDSLSHEHNETITDPDAGGGWYDATLSGENGDKCNFTFTGPLGSTVNGPYDVLINHNPYEIQPEWSNAITGCAMTYGAVPPTASFTYTPGSPKALDPVSFDGTGSHSNDTGGYIIKYEWTFGDGGTSTSATPSHPYAASGSYTVTLKVTDDAGMTETTNQTVTVVTRPTVTTYTGATSGQYHDSVMLKAHLVDQATSAALNNKPITFTLGSQSCIGTTNSSGDASCPLTLNQIPGTGYTVTASFAGDTVYHDSSDSSPFEITKEETTLAFVGPKVILAGSGTATFSAHLFEDGANDNDSDSGNTGAPNPDGQSVTFTIGGQSCTGTTTGSNVSCQISSISAATLGSKTINVSFSGDSYYLGSTDSASVIVFAFPNTGAFTVGDLTAAGGAGTNVSWWSDSWWSLNTLSGGTAPLSFKGFAGAVTTLPTQSPANVCGTSFTTLPGNSPPPVSGVPSYMGVLVPSSVTKSGSNINGAWASIIVVKVNPGYSPNPGHPGTGTIVATFCP
jgi:PKD repeat protein